MITIYSDRKFSWSKTEIFRRSWGLLKLFCTFWRLYRNLLWNHLDHREISAPFRPPAEAISFVLVELYIKLVIQKATIDAYKIAHPKLSIFGGFYQISVRLDCFWLPPIFNRQTHRLFLVATVFTKKQKGVENTVWNDQFLCCKGNIKIQFVMYNPVVKVLRNLVTALTRFIRVNQFSCSTA